MPVISDLKLISGNYTPATTRISFSGTALAETAGDTGTLRSRLHGAGSWSTATIVTWADSVAVGLVSALDNGSYDLQIINGDGETSNALMNAFSVPATAGGAIFFYFSTMK